jgi:hypothetical protein
MYSQNSFANFSDDNARENTSINSPSENQYSASRHDDKEYDYTRTSNDTDVLAMANGYLAKWGRKDENGTSLRTIHGKRWLKWITLRISAYAFLAAVDYTNIQIANGEHSQEPIVIAIARTGHIELARYIIRAYECLEFLDTTQNVNVNEDDFNYRIHICHSELITPLGECNLLTLCKYIKGQICTGINNCFDSRLRDLPIIFDPNTNNNDSSVYNVPTSRSPELASWHNHTSRSFIGSINELSYSYNRVLAHTVDISRAFQEADTRRRAYNADIRAKRQAEYVKERESRKSISKSSTSIRCS